MTTKYFRGGRPLLALSFITLTASIVAGCSGGDGGGGGGGSAPATTGAIGGAASKGPVSAAVVTAFAIAADGTIGDQLGTATTNSTGDFTMTNVAPYSGPLMLQVHGGSFMDEATGTQMNMHNGDRDMTCVVPAVTVSAGSTTSGIQITPLTSMAQVWAQNMPGQMSVENITYANMHIGAHYLGADADIVMTHPIDATVTGSANGATIDSKNYGMLLGAMSQQAYNFGMVVSSSGMITAMTNDASDGIMDGMMGGTEIDMTGMGGMMGGMMGGNMMKHTAGTSDLAAAMATFVSNPMNRSGVTDVSEMQAVMDQLNQLAANGGHL
jgi:hypothetical protein